MTKPVIARISLGMAAASLALLLTGCESVNTVSRAQSESSPEMVNDKRVYTDPTLTRSLEVVGINQSVVGGNLLKIQATVTNKHRKPLKFSYKFSWISKDGMAIETTASGWQFTEIQGSDTIYLTSVAPRPDAVDFTLKLKE